MNVRLTAATVLLAAGVLAMSAPAAAQAVGPDAYGPPVYSGWQTAWDRYEYDRHHVILGVVGRFEPYRLQIERRDGVWQTIDLKDGTVILPTGATPQPSQRVAIVGYYSKGTFVANRVILRN